MDIIQLIGYIAAFVVAVCLIPQVIKALKSKSTKDISIIWLIVNLFGLLLYLAYGIGIKQVPVIAGITIEIILTVLLFIAKIVYG